MTTKLRSARKPMVSARFFFEGEKGEYISGGRTKMYRQGQNGTIKVDVLEDRNGIRATVEGDGDSWALEFAAPRGQKLEARVYENAMHYAFRADHEPGINISGCGR